MKVMFLIVVVVLAIAFLPPSSAQFQQACLFCTGDLQVPTTWPELQDVLATACGWLITSPGQCTEMISAAKLETPYDKVYPYIVELKDAACEKFKNLC